MAFRNLSPINRRRLHNFRANRRGYWSFWIFLVLFFVTLLAEGIANDKPVLIRHDGRTFFPIFNFYAETEFGGDFATEADYRDPFLQELIAEKDGWIVWAPVPFSYRTIDRDLDMPAPAPPSWLADRNKAGKVVTSLARFKYCLGLAGPDTVGNPEESCARHWLGTDDQQRDVVARMIYGFRISVLFGLILTGISSVVGVIAGAVQGYYGGWVDLLFQRFIEIWTSIPQLYLIIIIAAVIEPSFWILLGILLLFSWVALVGVVRAEFLRARNFEYVRAARSLGVRNVVIMFRHLLPNAMVATLTFLPFILNAGITTLTSLDFLGFGLPPGSPSLGELLAQGKANLQAPWLGITAFFVIALMLSLLIFIGEAVRDAFDPRKVFDAPAAAEDTMTDDPDAAPAARGAS